MIRGVRYLAFATVLGAVGPATAAAQETVRLEYAVGNGPVRYILSQTGWQAMEPSPPSTGNVLAGYLEHRVMESGAEGVLHQVSITDLAVTFLLPGNVHVKQPSDQMLNVPVRLVTRAGQAPELVTPRDELASLPTIRGIQPSYLLVDVLYFVPTLPAGAVAPGASWTAEHERTVPGKTPDGTSFEHHIASSVGYTLREVVSRPVAFGSSERRPQARVTGRGTGTIANERGDFSSRTTETFTVEGYFDIEAGRWTAVAWTSESEMQASGGGRSMGGPMGFTDHFILVGPAR